jgi:hypothetical protein
MPDDPKNTPPADPAFSEAQVAALTELIGKTVNSAVTSHLKRQPQINVAEELKKALTKDAIAPIFSQLLEETPKDPALGQTPPPAKQDPKMAALEAQVSDMKAALQKQVEEANAARESAKAEKARSALMAALSPHVREGAAEMATQLLFDAQKRVTLDEQGNPLLTIRRAPYSGAQEEDVQMPLGDGLQHWLKTDQGKFFVPAPSAQPGRGGPPAPRPGSAARGVNGTPTYDKPATTDAEKIRRAQEQAQAFAEKFPHLTNNDLL